MELTLLPHWWETWWFRTLAISAVIGSVVIAFWWKDRIATAQRKRLEAMVEQRTAELREQVRKEERARAELSEAQQRLLELSRLCGMAEVATGVLHNVGNVLNSVNVCTTIVAEKIGEFRVNNLAAVIQMLQQHTGDMETFLREDERGRRLIPYLAKLAGSFQEDRDTAISELKQLRDHIDHIKAIVATQQKYAKVSGLIEELSLAGLVDDALRVVGPEFQIHEISVSRDFDDLPDIAADRHKIMQILLNLFRNATDAIVHNGGGTARQILVSIRRRQGNRVRIEVKDSGVGLEQQELARIFALGFTTKAHGHGFGLHSGALAAKQMSGSLWAESDGPGMGSTFILEIPANAVQERNAA
jgi:signal transduction histidine kinase